MGGGSAGTTLTGTPGVRLVSGSAVPDEHAHIARLATQPNRTAAGNPIVEHTMRRLSQLRRYGRNLEQLIDREH